MTTAADTLDFMAKNNINYVDLRFTVPRGHMQHLTLHASLLTEDSFKKGVMFDGSSVKGWKTIDESDVALIPVPDTAIVDPFYREPTITFFCDVVDPSTGQPYTRCPRSIAAKAEEYLQKSGIGDVAYFGPEAKFYIFDNVRFGIDPDNMFFEADAMKRRADKDCSLIAPINPIDPAQDMRTEMLAMMEQLGVNVEKHRHERLTSQHLIGISHAPLLQAADNIQLYKYVMHNVAHSYRKSATFMPKPLMNANGSGMHTHQSIWKKGKPLFAGKDYAGLSQNALYYIGGILKHARALNALTNPTTNSYKRLVPGYEAPTLLTYADRNRSASCRIPYADSPNAKRVEVRFPDASANPYLAFAAMLMAGIDGIKNKIDPGKVIDKDLNALSASERKKLPHLCTSLEEAIAALEKDHAFLLEGDVFTKDAIDSYLDIKREEAEALRQAPHPLEYALYFS
ncbi:MAG: type I glutamate--ammonia ligase [Bdellovibrionales bacterium]